MNEQWFFLLSGVIFAIGMLGVLINQKNLIKILISIELMLLAANINFVATSAFHDDVLGKIYAILVFTIAAAEVALGIVITILYFREKGHLSIAE